MKVGIVIACVLMVVVGALIIVASLGSPQKPSRDTADPKVLAKVSLPGGLPQVGLSKGTGGADKLYDEAIALYLANVREFEGENGPKAEIGDQMADLLIRAMEGGDVSEPFLDKYLGMSISPRQSKMGTAMQDIPIGMMRRAEKLKEGGKRDEAIMIARAVFVFGQRANEKCVRLMNRLMGLQAMTLSGVDLYNWSENDKALADQIDPWVDPINKVQKNWEHKLTILMSPRPHIGDIMNIAQNDQDLSFRMEAILRLGLVKWNPGTSANLRAVNRIIDNAMKDQNQYIRKAGEASFNFSKEDVHSIY